MWDEIDGAAKSWRCEAAGVMTRPLPRPAPPANILRFCSYFNREGDYTFRYDCILTIVKTGECIWDDSTHCPLTSDEIANYGAADTSRLCTAGGGILTLTGGYPPGAGSVSTAHVSFQQFQNSDSGLAKPEFSIWYGAS